MQTSLRRLRSGAQLVWVLTAALLWVSCDRSNQATDRPATITVTPGQGLKGRVPGGRVKMNAATLRAKATVKPSPHYPLESLAQGIAGVAVAEVTADSEGHVREVDVLEAPSKDVGAAVREAMLKWRFSPVRVVGESQDSQVFATFTFYFVINNGRGTVLTPEEMPDAPASGGNGAVKPPLN